MRKKAKNAAKALKRVVNAVAAGSTVFVGEKITAQRLDACHRCPSFLPKTGQCAECGCFVRVKAKLSTEACPLHKWPLTSV
jgi:ribosomal protein L37E